MQRFTVAGHWLLSVMVKAQIFDHEYRVDGPRMRADWDARARADHIRYITAPSSRRSK